jgi:hypothetical protein
MPSLFTTIPGTYAKVSNVSSGVALIEVPGLIPEETLIVTKYSYGQKTKVQYKSVLGGDIFVYPLGNEMGMVNISGIVAYQMCTGRVIQSQVGDGFTKLAQYFEDNKASSVKNIQNPISLTLPGLANFTEQCYLESIAISGVDPQNRIFGFNIVFRVAPRTSI